MAKKKTRSKKSQTPKNQEGQPSHAWLPTRTGIITLTIISLGLVVITVWQSSKALPFVESLIWGLIYGGSIWAIFLVVYLVNRFLRDR